MPARPGRLPSVDALRGAVMVLMALDHARDFFSSARFDPTDPERTTAVLFATRWVTHFCAPVFILLAGSGAYLQLAAGKSRPELARFLATRGLWLIFLELTAVHWGWNFSLGPPFGLQVIWAIGLSMVLLAPLVYLPPAAVGAFGVALVVLHDLADRVRASAFGSGSLLWRVLHDPGPFEVRGVEVWLAYPVVPWVGVMAAGFALGPLLVAEPAVRRARLLRLGLGMLAAFLVLRAINVYGDAVRWIHEPTAEQTVFSFLGVSKYPPSLDYVLATLGPALCVLAALDGMGDAKWLRPLLVFGRVPLFFYLLHLPLLHAGACLVAYLGHGTVPEAILGPPFGGFPPGYGVSLPGVYLAWIAAVAALYPACAWYAGVKRRNPHPVLSYV